MAPQRVSFTFENRTLEGVAGEPIAKALFRAGIRTLSYSVKYRRPRGIHCARGRCVMCHMAVDGVPGVPTCLTPLEEGMAIEREDFRPSFAPLLIHAARLFPFPAGFYYRMFTRPAWVRRLFLGSLGRMAGVGRLPLDGPRRTPPSVPGRRLRTTYDVIVVGAGVAGMATALAAADGGGDVLLVDEYGRTGGHAIGHMSDGDLAAKRDKLAEAVAAHPSIALALSTTALGFYPPQTLLLGPGGCAGLGAGGGAMTRVEAARVVFATGAYDVNPLFHDNDTPGIFGPRSLRLFLERDGLVPGRRAVVYGAGDAIETVYSLLRHHGIEVVAVVNAGGGGSDRFGDARVIANGRVKRARGGDWLRSVVVAAGDPGGSRTFTLGCDLLCTAFDGQGAYELAYQAGFRFELRDDTIADNRVMIPTRDSIVSADGVSLFVVGELGGQNSWREAVARGEQLGREIAGATRQTDSA